MAHNLLIDFLWGRDYIQIFVIPPSVVQSVRKRYNQSGAHADSSEAFLLAELLRTDRAHLQPWHPDSSLTQQTRTKENLIHFHTCSTVRLSNDALAVNRFLQSRVISIDQVMQRAELFSSGEWKHIL